MIMDVFKLWKEGSEAGIFVPELHGRDHTLAQMMDSKNIQGRKIKELLLAFDNGFVSLDIPGCSFTGKRIQS
jgi:hypothetical protein